VRGRRVAAREAADGSEALAEQKNNQTPKERINPRQVLQILTFAFKNLEFSLDDLIFSSEKRQEILGQLTETHFYCLDKLENIQNFLKNRQNS
jgi:hypothetical protein